MFCKNCGQQMGDTERFCPRCGNPTAQNPNPAPTYNPAPAYNPAPSYNPAPTYNPAPGYVPTAPVSAPGATGFKALGSNIVLYFITLGVLLMNIIFMYCPTLWVEEGSRYWGTYEYTVNFFAGYLSPDTTNVGVLVFLGVIILLAYVGGVVLSLLPIMTNKRWASKYFVCGRVASIVGLSFFLLFLMILLIAAADADVEAGLTFAGWMYMLCNIGYIVLSVVTPSRLKAANGR